MDKVKVKQSTRKVSRVQFDPATLVDIPRDPARRLPARTASEFVPPVPATVASLRNFSKPSTRIKKPEEHKKENSNTKWSDLL